MDEVAIKPTDKELALSALLDLEALLHERNHVMKDIEDELEGILSPEQEAQVDAILAQIEQLQNSIANIPNDLQKIEHDRLTSVRDNTAAAYNEKETLILKSLSGHILACGEMVSATRLKAEIEPGKRSGATVPELETAAKLVPPEIASMFLALIKPGKRKVVVSEIK